MNRRPMAATVAAVLCGLIGLAILYGAAFVGLAVVDSMARPGGSEDFGGTGAGVLVALLGVLVLVAVGVAAAVVGCAWRLLRGAHRAAGQVTLASVCAIPLGLAGETPGYAVAVAALAVVVLVNLPRVSTWLAQAA